MNNPMLKPQLGQIETASSNPISGALTPYLLKPTPSDVHKLIGSHSFAKSMTSEEILNAFAHCDGPCGVYDPASARIAGEAVQSMTKKMLDLTYPDDPAAMATYINTMSRYAAIKEKEAQKCKDELLVLWTDFFKPQHLESIPSLHDTFWKAAKLCSACKVEVSAVHAQELMDAIEAIHHMFWTAKGRDDAWVRAS
jgi:nickel superoxide dismutase